jgi:hypothetical protein
MSKEQNTLLLERASEQIDYWTGTMHARVIEADIDRDDLEALREHVVQAEREMAIQEDPIMNEETNNEVY